jgi:hypothetical protein
MADHTDTIPVEAAGDGTSKPKGVGRGGNGKTGKDNPGSFQPGEPSANPSGRPRKGNTWRERIEFLAGLTPVALADHLDKLQLSTQFRELGDKVVVKDIVIASVLASLINDPQAAMLREVMDRTDGKPTQEVNTSVRMLVVDE